MTFLIREEISRCATHYVFTHNSMRGCISFGVRITDAKWDATLHRIMDFSLPRTFISMEPSLPENESFRELLLYGTFTAAKIIIVQLMQLCGQCG